MFEPHGASVAQLHVSERATVVWLGGLGYYVNSNVHGDWQTDFLGAKKPSLTNLSTFASSPDFRPDDRCGVRTTVQQHPTAIAEGGRRCKRQPQIPQIFLQKLKCQPSGGPPTTTRLPDRCCTCPSGNGLTALLCVHSSFTRLPDHRWWHSAPQTGGSAEMAQIR